MDDVRVQWVGERLQRGLGHSDPSPFEELLNRNDGEETEQLLHFLNMSASAEDSQAAGLFFRQELRLDEIDVEIGARPAHLRWLAGDGLLGTCRCPSRKKRNPLPKESHSLLPMTPPPQKIVKQEVYNLYYHMAVNDIPEEFVESDTIFFLRETAETVSEPNDLAEANDVLPEVLEYGILNNNTLLMLKQILALVRGFSWLGVIFRPSLWLCGGLSSEVDNPLVFDSYQNLRNEFLMNMQKFLSHIQRTIQQIEGELWLGGTIMSITGEGNFTTCGLRLPEFLRQSWEWKSMAHSCPPLL
uniref:Uncharacterized protein n=1 Tax=Laticauda laticaudata TaxID=8630 RepID=A0A8C5S9R1_LATLA